MKRKIYGFIIAAMLILFPSIVSAEEPIAKVGDETYATLQEAVDATEYSSTPTTIEILRSTEEGEQISGIIVYKADPKNIIIDFKGYTLQFGEPLLGSPGTESQNIHLEEGSTFVLKNGTMIAYDKAAFLIQNYANLTLEDMTLDITDSTYNGATYALSINSGIVNITGDTSIYSNDYAFDAYWWPKMGYTKGAQITVDTTGTIKGLIDVSSDGSDLESKTTLTLKNLKHDGKMSIEEGLEKNVSILGGSFSTKDDSFPLEEGAKFYEVLISEGETKYVVAKESELVDKVMTNEIEESRIEAEEKELIEEAAADKYTIVGYYNIDLGKFTPNSDLVGLTTETEKDIKVTLPVPEDLTEVKDGFTRKYAIIRIHDGKSDIIEATDNGDGTISFATNKFSTYVLTYEDVEAIPENPNTFDGMSTYLLFGTLSLIGLVAACVYINKKKLFN